jgi:hypothetical protein
MHGLLCFIAVHVDSNAFALLALLITYCRRVKTLPTATRENFRENFLPDVKKKLFLALHWWSEWNEWSSSNKKSFQPLKEI